MTLRTLVPEEGECIVLVSGAPGVRCFNVALIGHHLHWECFSDAFAPTRQASFGSYRLQPQQRAEFEQDFQSCRAFPQTFEPGQVRLELKFEQAGEAKTHMTSVGAVSAASDAAEQLSTRCWQLLKNAAAQADAAHTGLCFHTEDFGACELREGEVLMIQRPISGAEQRVRLRVSDLSNAGAPAERIEALTRGASPVQSGMALAHLDPAPTRSTRRPSGLFAMRVAQKVRSFLRKNDSAAFDDVFTRVQKRSKAWARAASVTDAIRRSRLEATTTQSGIRPAVPRADVVVDPPERIAAARLVAGREGLEGRLRSPYALDGSFASLWAVERVLSTLRRAPKLMEKASWLAPYLAQVFGRAFVEMGGEVSWRGTSSLVAHFPDAEYAVDTAQDLRKLANPPKRFPAFYGQYWTGLEDFGPARTPWYGLATVFQNHAWAQTDHGPIGEQRTRMVRAIPWLVSDQVASLPLGVEHGELARNVARAMVWPPLGYAQNERGEHNLPKLKALLAEADGNETRTVLDAFVGMQDRAFQLLAAATSIHFAIPPDNRHEAMVYRDAQQFFRLGNVPPFIQQAIRSLGGKLETPLRGRAHATYHSVFNASPEEGVRMAEQVLASEPNLPAFHCMAGRHHERLGHDTPAIRCYTRAIELKPDYAQALINRGSLFARRGDFDSADADFFAARHVRPEDDDLRNNLLLNFFFANTPRPNAEPKSSPNPSTRGRVDLAPKLEPVFKATSTFSIQTVIPDGDPEAEQAGAQLRSVMNAYANKRANTDVVMRALMSHTSFVVPYSLLPKPHGLRNQHRKKTARLGFQQGTRVLAAPAMGVHRYGLGQANARPERASW